MLLSRYQALTCVCPGTAATALQGVAVAATGATRACMVELRESTAETTEEAVTMARVADTTTADLAVAEVADILVAVHGTTMTGRQETSVAGARREAASISEDGIPVHHLA